jgi:hypothetical protein
LLLLVGFGLVVVGLIGYINIQNIKKNMDTLYFGSLLPLSELTMINSTYHNDLASSIYQWNNQLLSDEQVSDNIVQGLEKSNHLWGSYLSHHIRLGGEEFGIILTDTDCHNARIMGEKVRASIEHLKIEHKGSKILPTLSVSIGGICIVPKVDMGEDALIHEADTNLYAAKERGRNQVVFSDKL